MRSPSREVAMVGTLTAPPSWSGRELRALPASVRWLEVRADLVGDLDPVWLRSRFDGELLYTLRSRAHGGSFKGSPAERLLRLQAAAERYDLVDLEAEHDLAPELLATVPAGRRIVSWCGHASGTPELARRLEQMAAVPARLYRLAPAASTPQQALAPLELLKWLGRRDVTAFATGTAAIWSRLLAPFLGAPVVFGRVNAAGGNPAQDGAGVLGAADPGAQGAGATGLADADGELPLERLVADYGFPELPPPREMGALVGSARSSVRSLSPRLHNAAYRQLGLPALYLPFAVSDLPSFWREVVEEGLPALGLPLRGVTVTSPHKEAALALAGAASPFARLSAGANLLRPLPDGSADGSGPGAAWLASTTDAVGAVEALASNGIATAGRRTAVIGCGGAGRAAAAGLLRAGAQVTLVNRGHERGHLAARLLGLPFVPLSKFSPEAFSLVVHATSIQGDLPFAVRRLDHRAAILDLVYGTTPTPLAAAVRARRCTVVDGWEVLRVEVQRQFRLMTGRRMPDGLVGALLGRRGERDGAREIPGVEPELVMEV
jgi:3-dehydroquinate dehydratase/shikimate dehydrogenase